MDRLITDELSPVFSAIMLTGPRGSGKSTSMAQIADTVLDLSVPGTALAATEDPDGILATATGTVLIDEWQEAPDILGAVKRIVDSDRQHVPGRFIVAGSVRAAHQTATWPGTGRFIRVRMYGLTQAELERNNTYNPIDAFFADPPPTFERSELSRNDYLDRIVAGRFPDLTRLSGRNRSRWLSGYIDQLLDRDVERITAARPEPLKLRSVLTSCAARTSQQLNKAATADDAGVNVRTADRAVELLEDLSVIFRMPAWHTTRLKRLTRSPKVHLTDPGMAAHLLGTDAMSLGRSPALVGPMFETFVAAELATHIETAANETNLFHLRDQHGHEVDIILEQAGRIVGLEIKSSTKVDRSDTKALRWLRDQTGSDFGYGAVLYTGALPYRIDDRIWALPISSLWRAPEPAA